MKTAGLVALAPLAVALAVMLPITTHGQAPPAPKTARAAPPVARTPDGQPDIQGLWNSIDAFFTPLERPSKLAGKTNVSQAELDEVLKEEADRKVDGALNAGTGSYGREWYEYREGRIDSRPSLVIDPPDGRIPPLTAWAKDKAGFTRTHATESYEFLDPGDRCVTRGILGMMLPTFYNNGKQIIQTPGYVTIVSEMIHDARVIPIDGRPHAASSVRSWTGDPRGHWEGNTLVVETTNFSARDVLRGIRVQTDSLKMIERFTAVDGNTLMYRATIDDRKVYTKPWTIEFAFKRDNDYRMFEYACHEGNHAVEGILHGARVEEAKAAGRDK